MAQKTSVNIQRLCDGLLRVSVMNAKLMDTLPASFYVIVHLTILQSHFLVNARFEIGGYGYRAMYGCQ